jgi:hypothetical protein
VAEWRLEPVAEIAPAGESAFMRVVSLAVDGDGSIFAADRGAFQVRVFDSLGAPLRAIGRKGSGPGEFRDIYSLAWAGGTRRCGGSGLCWWRSVIQSRRSACSRSRAHPEPVAGPVQPQPNHPKS